MPGTRVLDDRSPEQGLQQMPCKKACRLLHRLERIRRAAGEEQQQQQQQSIKPLRLQQQGHTRWASAKPHPKNTSLQVHDPSQQELNSTPVRDNIRKDVDVTAARSDSFAAWLDCKITRRQAYFFVSQLNYVAISGRCCWYGMLPRQCTADIVAYHD